MGSRENPITFGQRLRKELDGREWGVRTLARHMETDPRRIETVRRNLIRYLQDKHVPTVQTQWAIADALGVPREEFVVDDARREKQEASDDDEEGRSMAVIVSDLLSVLDSRYVRRERAA